jgi:hypothetical protein
METPWFESDRHGLLSKFSIVLCLSFSRRDITDRFQQSMVIEPAHPFQRGQLYSLAGLPGSASVNPVRLVHSVDGFSQSIIVAVAFAADRGLDAGFAEPLAVADRDVLRAPVAMVDQGIVAFRLARTRPVPGLRARNRSASNCSRAGRRCAGRTRQSRRRHRQSPACAWALALACVTLMLADPALQGFGCAANLPGNRHDRGPLQCVLRPGLGDHAHGALHDLG